MRAREERDYWERRARELLLRSAGWYALVEDVWRHPEREGTYTLAQAYAIERARGA